MEIGKLAIVAQHNKGKGNEFYPPRFLRLVMWKWAIEFHVGCVKDSLKALKIIMAGGKP